jgi:hypothetical protein
MNRTFWMGALASVAGVLLLAGSAAAQGGELVGAEWGVPGNRVDVTARVRTFVNDGILQLQVTRFNLGIDPAPHQVKNLVIRLREWDGDVKDYSYPERSVVRLELDPPRGYDQRARYGGRDHDGDRHERREEAHERRERGLRIERAFYGAEGRFVNVTESLRSRVDDGRLYI